MSRCTALKERVIAAEPEHEPEHGPALAQVRWVLGRYAGAGTPGCTAPSSC